MSFSRLEVKLSDFPQNPLWHFENRTGTHKRDSEIQRDLKLRYSEETKIYFEKISLFFLALLSKCQQNLEIFKILWPSQNI